MRPANGQRSIAAARARRLRLNDTLFKKPPPRTPGVKPWTQVLRPDWFSPKEQSK